MKYNRIAFICGALFAAVFASSSPALAGLSIHPGHDVLVIHASPYDISADLAKFTAALDREDKAFSAREFALGRSLTDIERAQFNQGRTPTGLKPDYEASYATDGLSFVETRLRC